MPQGLAPDLISCSFSIIHVGIIIKEMMGFMWKIYQHVFEEVSIVIKIPYKEVEIGPYPRILNPGDVQSMIFTTLDSGPFYKREGG